MLAQGTLFLGLTLASRILTRYSRIARYATHVYCSVNPLFNVLCNEYNSICASELLEMLELAVKPFWDRTRETAERIVDDREDRLIASMRISLPFAILTPLEENHNTEPPGESNRFQPMDLRVQRGSSTNLAYTDLIICRADAAVGMPPSLLV